MVLKETKTKGSFEYQHRKQEINKMHREDEERFREWLDLDQADDDIGLLPNEQLQLQQESNCLTFATDDDQFNPLRLLQQHQHQHHQQTLDPSTIFNYASVEPSSTTQLQNHNLSTYALDPALVSASVPSHYPPLGGNATRVPTPPSNTSDNHHPTPSCPPPSKISLPRRSVPSFFQRDNGIELDDDDDDDDHDEDLERGPSGEANRFKAKVNRSHHSRSSSAVLFATPAQTHKRTLSHSHSLVNVPDWEDKPSAEEYKMLSSKEKRQLRNKISARNFRHRRKQHISTLEQQLAQRDQAIQSLNNDLGQVRLENKELKFQVEVLKQKWSDLMKKIEDMSLNSITHPNSTTASSLTTTSTGSQSSSNFLNPASPRSRSAKTNGMIPLPNLHKDLGSHTRKPFNGVGGMTGGGNVGVHTTLIPEVTIDVYEEPFLVRNNNPTRCNLLPPHHASSPQALIELKLLHEKLLNQGQPTNPAKKELELGLDAVPSIIDPSNPNKTRSIDFSPRMEVNLKNYDPELCQEYQKQVKERLTRMVFEALQIEKPESDDRLDVSNSLDLQKLQACLDGRMAFKLVELSPPPYRLVSSLNSKPTTTTTTATSPSSSGLNSSSATDNQAAISLIQSFENITRLSAQFSHFQM